MPSSGRASCALLDLSRAMENANYVQIVAVREEEKDDYFKVALAHSDLDVYVIKDQGHKKTIGQARHALKMLGEKITRGRPRWIFMCDDNISHWSGVTLINDPCPMFEKEPSHEESQLSDISLKSLLTHFSSEELAKFSIVGFSMFSKKQIRNKRSAYARAHVFAAVLLNLDKLTKVKYNKRHWAMEDIAHMGSEGRLYSSKSTNGGKGLKNSKINSYFTP